GAELYAAGSFGNHEVLDQRKIGPRLLRTAEQIPSRGAIFARQVWRERGGVEELLDHVVAARIGAHRGVHQVRTIETYPSERIIAIAHNGNGRSTGYAHNTGDGPTAERFGKNALRMAKERNFVHEGRREYVRSVFAGTRAIGPLIVGILRSVAQRLA